jgi:asparaginyl-tRNA synthetase
MKEKVWHISDIPKKEGKKITLRGWIYNIRSSGGILFILLRDSTGIAQCTVRKDSMKEETFSTIEHLGLESTIKVVGNVKKDKRAPGGFEVRVSKVEVLRETQNYPLTKKKHGAAFLRDYRHLHLRSPKLTAVMKIKHEVLQAIREWFIKHDFYEVTPPIIVKTACEGGSTLFKMHYFDQEAYLSQSAQLYLEAMIYSLEKVFAVTPSFRAEKSRTTRHLAEYWHIEGEMAWCDFEDNMEIQEQLIEYTVQAVVKRRKDELKTLDRDVKSLKKVKTPFPRITYDKAIEMLKKDGFKVSWGLDFGTKEERQLSTHFQKPFFIMEFPKKIKAFYMKEASDPRKVLGADLIAPQGYGELIGGSQREDDFEKIKQRLKEEGERLEDYEWYLDLRRYGSVPHSGFGLGTERLVRWICDLDHIDKTIPFPRTVSRVYP